MLIDLTTKPLIRELILQRISSSYGQWLFIVLWKISCNCRTIVGSQQCKRNNQKCQTKNWMLVLPVDPPGFKHEMMSTKEADRSHFLEAITSLSGTKYVKTLFFSSNRINLKHCMRKKFSCRAPESEILITWQNPITWNLNTSTWPLWFCLSRVELLMGKGLRMKSYKQ